MRNRFFYIALLLVIVYAIPSEAQYMSVRGRFQVSNVKGCAPFTVSITTFTVPFQCNGMNPCDMDFRGNNVFQSLTFSHTYTDPGTYWLKILFQGSGLDSIQIEAVTNIQPTFDVYACSGNRASFKITDTNYNQYVVNYNDGSPVDIVPSGSLAQGTHTYASSGTQSITVRGRNLNAQDNCSSMIHTFATMNSLPAPFINELTVLDATQIQLNFTNQNYILYRLEIAVNNGATFQQLQTIYNTNSAIVPNLRTDDNFYCFRLGAYDPCSNTTTYSNTICSSNFDLSVQDNVNKLTWITSPTGVQDYSLPRNDQPYVNVPVALNTFDDVDVICKTTYCYQHVINYTNGSTSYSMRKCGVAFSTTSPTPIQDITAIVNENDVSLTWVPSPSFTPMEYTILRSSDGSFSPHTTLPGTAISYADQTYSNGLCYRIIYKDMCDNTSTSNVTVCPINLTGTLNADNSVSLNWSEYSGWQNGVQSYTLEKYTQAGSLLQTFPLGSTTSFTDDVDDLVNQVYIYVVKATANDLGFTQSISNALVIIKEPNLFYPTAFTPNGDNLNDNFVVYGQYVVSFEMKIFNRWGELMFTTNNIEQGWDGNYRGNEMPEGTYTFVANLTDFAGRTFNRSGSVLLLRKK